MVVTNMIKIVKSGKDMRYKDLKTGEIYEWFDPTDFDLGAEIQVGDDNDTVITFSHDEIECNSGNILSARLKGITDPITKEPITYILDDEYQPKLIRAGYFVKNDYDIIRASDAVTGAAVFDEVSNEFEDAISNVRDYYVNEGYHTTLFVTPSSTKNSDYKMDPEFEMEIQGSTSYKLIIKVFSVNTIVAINIARKLNMLPFYPFNKQMDASGCRYCCIYAEKIKDCVEDSPVRVKFGLADEFVTHMVSELISNGNKYKFVPMGTRKRIIACDGM